MTILSPAYASLALQSLQLLAATVPLKLDTDDGRRAALDQADQLAQAFADRFGLPGVSAPRAALEADPAPPSARRPLAAASSLPAFAPQAPAAAQEQVYPPGVVLVNGGPPPPASVTIHPPAGVGVAPPAASLAAPATPPPGVVIMAPTGQTYAGPGSGLLPGQSKVEIFLPPGAEGAPSAPGGLALVQGPPASVSAAQAPSLLDQWRQTNEATSDEDIVALARAIRGEAVTGEQLQRLQALGLVNASGLPLQLGRELVFARQSAPAVPAPAPTPSIENLTTRVE